MGRKIPAKKHHGTKDPIQQNARRNAKIKLKINETPANIDDQEVPKKIRHLFSSKKVKPQSCGDPPLSKLQADPKNPRLPQRPVKKIPKFQRIPGESDRDFLWRTEQETRQYLNKAKFENKYGVDVEVDGETGEVVLNKKKKLAIVDDVLKVEPQNKQERRKLRKLEKLQQEKEERRKLKLEKLKAWKLSKKNKGIKHDEFSVLKQDKVEFGEVAEQPPTITAKPRKSVQLEKPGTRNLLLKGMIRTNQQSALSGKRKDLSALDRQRLEDERQRAVDLYRQIQKQKQANKTN